MESIKINEKDFFYYPSDDLVVEALVKHKILYGEPNFNLLNKYVLDKDAAIVDCGAHIGTFSFSAARNGRKVILVEGADKNAKCLQKTFEDFENVHVEHAILLDAITKCNFSSDYGPFGSAAEDENGSDTSNTLDNIIDTLHIDNIGGIKYDIEGNEISAIDGSLKTINKYKPTLLIEVNGFALMEQGKKPFHLFDKLEELGYNYYLPRGENQLLSIDRYSKYPFCISDIVCIHKDKIDLYDNLDIHPPMSDTQIYRTYKSNYLSSNGVCRKYFDYIK